MYTVATPSGSDYYIPDLDAPTDIFATVGDMSAEEYLARIDGNVSLLTSLIYMMVTVGFAILIVYLICKPIFYFLK